jgi:hypothetical protein
MRMRWRKGGEEWKEGRSNREEGGGGGRQRDGQEA